MQRSIEIIATISHGLQNERISLQNPMVADAEFFFHGSSAKSLYPVLYDETAGT